MGMDVIGRSPRSEKGRYFRNNVWWWHPLADYIEHVAPQIYAKYHYWHSNDGGGLSRIASEDLASILGVELDSGRTALYANERQAQLDALPRETCEHCHGTGIRTDEVGVRYGQDKKVIDEPGHPRHGQTGWCNGCNGVGSRKSFAASYGFSEENVREFVEFLRDCGGFKIC